MASVAFTENFLQYLVAKRAQEEFYDSTFNCGASFGLRVGRSGRKAFFLIYRVGSKRKRLTLGLFPVLSLEGARREALGFLRLLNEGRDPIQEWKHNKRVLTFEIAGEEFLETHAWKQCREKTVLEYQRIIKKEILPSWADRDVRRLSSNDVNGLLRQIADTRKHPVLASRVRALLHKMFNYFNSCGYINSNPVSSTLLFAVPTSSARALRNEELRLLWRVLDSVETNVAEAIKMLLFTGQSVLEISSMRWHDIHGDVWLAGPSKINHGRAHLVSLSPQAQALLRNMSIARKSGQYVFPARAEFPIRNIRFVLKRLSQKCGIVESVSSRDLRFTVESNFRGLEVRPDVIAYIFNRKTAFKFACRRGIENRTEYDELSKRALAAWGRKLAEVVGPSPREQLDDKVVALFPRRND